MIKEVVTKEDLVLKMISVLQGKEKLNRVKLKKSATISEVYGVALRSLEVLVWGMSGGKSITGGLASHISYLSEVLRFKPTYTTVKITGYLDVRVLEGGRATPEDIITMSRIVVFAHRMAMKVRFYSKQDFEDRVRFLVNTNVVSVDALAVSMKLVDWDEVANLMEIQTYGKDTGIIFNGDPVLTGSTVHYRNHHSGHTLSQGVLIDVVANSGGTSPLRMVVELKSFAGQLGNYLKHYVTLDELVFVEPYSESSCLSYLGMESRFIDWSAGCHEQRYAGFSRG